MGETSPRVLVVDDERFFREAIAEVLGEAGIVCDAASSASELLEAACDPQLAVVLLDVAFGGRTGVELLRELREAHPGVRVIVVSARPEHELVLEALRIGACDYLAKPLHDEELVLAVRRALAGFDVEARGARLRRRLRLAETRTTALAGWEDDGSQAAFLAFAEATVDAIAALLDAGKTSFMLYDEGPSELRVVAANGSELEAGAMDPVALGEGVAGVALSLGEALLVEDVYSDARFPQRTGRERYDSASIAVVPLRTDHRALGVLCATDRAGGVPFGEDELALFQLLAVPVTQFLRRRVESRAPQDASAAHPSRRDPDAALARAVCEALVREIEPGSVFDSALDAASQRLGGVGVALHLIDNRSGDLVREHAVTGQGPGDRARVRRDRGATALVLQSGRALSTAQPEREEAFDPDVDTAIDGEGRPFVCVPLELRGKVVGVLRAFPEARDLPGVDTCEMLSTTLSAAVRNVLLYRSLLESIDELSEARREAGAVRLS